MSTIVSFISPNFNRAKFIGETLNSLLAQTDPRWENVIVDDGSTDDSVEIIESYVKRDSRFRFYRRDREPKGACPCRNIGVEKAIGRYLVFLDTDDLAAPHCAEQRIREMESRPEIDFGVFQAQLFARSPNDKNVYWNIDKPNESELQRQFQHDAICQGTGPAFNTNSFKKLGGWDESLSIWQDIDLFLRAYISEYKYIKCFSLPPDIFIRENEASISRSNLYTEDKLASRIRIIRMAVEQLETNEKTYHLPLAMIMAVDVASAVIRFGSREMTKDYCNWFLNTFHHQKWCQRVRFGALLKGFGIMGVSRVQRLWAESMKIPASSENLMGRVAVVS